MRCFSKLKYYYEPSLNSFFSDEPTGRLALVFELMEMNMYDAIKGNLILALIQ